MYVGRPANVVQRNLREILEPYLGAAEI